MVRVRCSPYPRKLSAWTRRGITLGISGLLGILVLVSPLGAAVGTEISGHNQLSVSSPRLELKFRSVSDTSDCLDYMRGAPCTNCILNGTIYKLNSTGTVSVELDAVCLDVLTAIGVRQDWKAYYFHNDVDGLGAVSLGETQGTLYPGQSLDFFFGLWNSCYTAYYPVLVEIVGPYNNVDISFSGCG